MIKVKLTYPFNWPIVKQTPHRSGKWGDCVFYINQDVEECDFWVVFEGLERNERTKCNPANTLLVTAEPPTIKTYNTSFVDQFNWVLSCHDFKRANVIRSQQGLNWMVGGCYQKDKHSWSEVHSKDYDELTSINQFDKTKLISIVTSNKSLTDDHKARVRFINEARDLFGEELDVFGVGFNEISDKWDAIYPYKYHIALENSLIKDYWTEKLTDAFLGGAYPFYHGCPNIDEYFPVSSLTPINIFNYHESLSEIAKVIKENKYESSYDSIGTSRDLILNKFNLMAVLSEFCELNSSAPSEKKKLSLFPERTFVKTNRFSLSNVKSFLFR
ncbi:MAG: hypothetical protein DI538_05160 [Azospira oryzae]|jgi:hypothetical protein|nr:MAG: hypothetical protein DI538_05160 [Azospira oryzae]